jgi:hypothetical protein
MVERKASRKAAKPVVVGVTGHRDIASDDAKISALVRKELRAIARANRGAPLLILSGLAEGADRLVAEIAREEFDAELCAVLPLPDALYERDFGSRKSVKDYRSLKGASQCVVAAPLMAARRSLTRYCEPRNHQYAWIGAFIAKRAQVLIAIWDGAPARGTGGTAYVVDWFLSGRVPGAYRLSRAPRVPARKRVAGTLVHIDPRTRKVRRRRRSRARG